MPIQMDVVYDTMTFFECIDICLKYVDITDIFRVLTRNNTSAICVGEDLPLNAWQML